MTPNFMKLIQAAHDTAVTNGLSPPTIVSGRDEFGTFREMMQDGDYPLVGEQDFGSGPELYWLPANAASEWGLR